MNLTYKKATIEDIGILTETRIQVLRAANHLSNEVDLSEVRKQSYHYYQKALCDGTHVAYLIFDEHRFAGAGGVSFFQVMPTYHNPSGKKAYIMNMYTSPEYRRKGDCVQDIRSVSCGGKKKRDYLHLPRSNNSRASSV